MSQTPERHPVSKLRESALQYFSLCTEGMTWKFLLLVPGAIEETWERRPLGAAKIHPTSEEIICSF